jgi:adenylate cyclase
MLSPEGVIDVKRYLADSHTRVLEILENRHHHLNSGIGRGEQFLLPYAGSTLKLVVFYADLVGSTLMTRKLSVDKLATIIQLFTQEMSIAVSKFGGHVLKYVGDAVIAYFPIDAKFSFACDCAINCSQLMITILREAINPLLNKHNYEELQLKIGIDTSEHSVIQYALEEKTYLDILGYGISMAAKLSSLAKPNQIVISHAIYVGLHPSLRKKFSELELDPAIWKYTDKEFQPGVWKSIT